MRTRVLCVVTAMFLLACCGFGQRAPVPALSSPLGDDLSVSYMLVAKDSSLNVGNGADFTSTHYFTEHLGISAQTEAMRMDRFQVREVAARMGATYRFNVGANYQPFVRVFAGYSGVSATYFGPTRPHKYGGSLLAGAGTDVRVRGPLFARLTLDAVDNWDAKTRFARGAVGFAYHFGDGISR
jgi:hypothetical protein